MSSSSSSSSPPAPSPSPSPSVCAAYERMRRLLIRVGYRGGTATAMATANVAVTVAAPTPLLASPSSPELAGPVRDLLLRFPTVPMLLPMLHHVLTSFSPRLSLWLHERSPHPILPTPTYVLDDAFTGAATAATPRAATAATSRGTPSPTSSSTASTAPPPPPPPSSSSPAHAYLTQVYTLLLAAFGYHPKLTVRQCLLDGYVERKLEFVCDVLEACVKTLRELEQADDQQQQSRPLHRRSASAVRASNSSSNAAAAAAAARIAKLAEPRRSSLVHDDASTLSTRRSRESQVRPAWSTSTTPRSHRIGPVAAAGGASAAASAKRHAAGAAAPLVRTSASPRDRAASSSPRASHVDHDSEEAVDASQCHAVEPRSHSVDGDADHADDFVDEPQRGRPQRSQQQRDHHEAPRSRWIVATASVDPETSALIDDLQRRLDALPLPSQAAMSTAATQFDHASAPLSKSSLESYATFRLRSALPSSSHASNPPSAPQPSSSHDADAAAADGAAAAAAERSVHVDDLRGDHVDHSAPPPHPRTRTNVHDGDDSSFSALMTSASASASVRVRLLEERLSQVEQQLAHSRSSGVASTAASSSSRANASVSADRAADTSTVVPAIGVVWRPPSSAAAATTTTTSAVLQPSALSPAPAAIGLSDEHRAMFDGGAHVTEEPESRRHHPRSRHPMETRATLEALSARLAETSKLLSESRERAQQAAI